MTRILLFGANGQLGHALRGSLAPLGEVVCATRSGTLGDAAACEQADFDRPWTLPPLIDRVAPDIVVNAAAHTAVDRAESEPEAAFRVNAEAPGAVALACAARDAMLVHYSTDYVFDGAADRPYREDDPTAPLNVYGSSKLAGEEAVRASDARHLLLRTSWVYAAGGRNFLRTMLRLAAERDELRVVDDQIGAPTPAAWLARATAAALRRPPPRSGLWHASTSGCTSWYGFATAIFELAQARGLLARPPRLIPIPTSAHPTEARRPAWSCLDPARFCADFGIAAPPWREALAEVLDELERRPRAIGSGA